mgnify:FL=1
MTRHNQLRELFEKNNIEYQENIVCCDKVCDFKVKDTYIIIAISALYNMHFVPFSYPISKNYFKNLQTTFETNDNRLIFVWDWDELNKIVNMFTEKQKVRASSCVLQEISTSQAVEFLNKYHFQKSCRGQKICLGLYYENNLIEVMTFGNPRYNKNYEYELLRLCTHNSYIVYGGAKKLFSYFIEHYCTNSIISYCDCSKFNGNVYKELHFVQRPATPSIHWIRLEPFTHITDNMLRYKGADKLIGTFFGKGSPNDEIMKGAGFLPVPDCGQDTYIYTV